MKGSTVARGYGRHHKRLRAVWARQVEAGQVDCARCGRPIFPGQAFDLDHSDDRLDYLGPSHVYCNRAHVRRYPAKRRYSRDW